MNPPHAQVVNYIYEISAFGKYVLDPRTQNPAVRFSLTSECEKAERRKQSKDSRQNFLD